MTKPGRPGEASEDVTDDLQQTHAALCSSFVDERRFRDALGGSRGDIGTIVRYLRFPPLHRPALSLFFDGPFYLASNPDVRDTGQDPLVHFLTSGFQQLRSPHPLIDLQFILSQDESLLGQPLRLGALQELLELDLASSSPYFDMSFYVRELGAEAPDHGLLGHFLTTGLTQGRRPNAYLDVDWYAASRADIPTDRYSALRHFIVLGDLEGHACSEQFDGVLYRRRYPDVAGAGLPPLRHYLLHGRHEGRQALAESFAHSHAKPAGSERWGNLAPGHPMPVEVASARADFGAMNQRLDEMRQVRKDSVAVAEPRMLHPATVQQRLSRLTIPYTEAPRLSILIPFYNELNYTADCLQSVVDTTDPGSYEIVVADDGSDGDDVRFLADVPNLVYIRQSKNVGFIENCNDAFAHCTAPYVLLLNNDTQLLPQAIDRMAAILDADPTVAAVGPKLIYPNGRLQEAGCYIRTNGESGMVGLFSDPNEAGYCHDRDVIYCSGAALMFRRELAGPKLFDTAYLPAYCEDADLCLRFIAAGYRVRYAHEAVVVHFLSVSTNRLSMARKHRRIMRNQSILSARWSELLASLDRIRPIAFYLPQFHPTPENDMWWGAGFTEWTNVAKAQPSYAGQYQPHLPADLGYYDLRSRHSLVGQANLARRYGIEGFCVYHYNFGSRRVLSQPLDVVRADPSIPFRWCLCWANENWTKHWDGGDAEILLQQSYDDATLDAITADLVSDAADPRYITINGKALFLVYRPLKLPDAAGFAARCRAAFSRAGLPGVHLVYVESMEAIDCRLRPVDIGFDAAVEFPPQGRAVATTRTAEVLKDGWSGYRYDYPQTVRAFLERNSVSYPRYPSVFPSWDNTARQPLRGTSFDDASPEAFRVYVEAKIEEARNFFVGDERLLFVNAWNEWAEGAHLEPDTGYGHRWLEALRDAVSAKAIR